MGVGSEGRVRDRHSVNRRQNPQLWHPRTTTAVTTLDLKAANLTALPEKE
jgi:hypothetical protein